ncbi:MAG: DUF302 domain-containing protein [Gallionellaceae bacterium]|nr:DUF302 domain-containing protein [Gallionellaceae bacterium]MDD5365789.1 DUF302 domain-containing protein [Gallionellaceae bacterium]
MKALPFLFAALVYAGSAGAQTPAPQLTQEQAQQLMARQMQVMAATFDYRHSRLGFDETVTALGAAIARQGWKPGPIHDAQAAMAKSGAAAGKRMKVLEACPAGFNDQLAKASQGKLPPHPCRFTVFEGQDGKTYVMRLNSAFIAKGIEGEAGKMMSFIGADEDAILKGIVE